MNNAKNPSNFLDSHCHLQDSRVDPFRKEWIDRAFQAGIREFALGGVGPEDWVRQEKIRAEFPEVRFHLSAGLHPWWVSEYSREEVDAALEALAELFAKDPSREKWIALGETGLDHQDRFTEAQRALQLDAFKAQLILARKAARPVVLHVVQAHGEALNALEEAVKAGPLRGGIVHSFSAAPEVARAYRKHGFLPSISAAVITRGSGKAFHALRETVLEMRLSDLLVETDSPDQPPVDAPRDEHGKKPMNPPDSLRRVAEGIAEWKGCSAEEVLAASTENWKRIFLA